MLSKEEVVKWLSENCKNACGDLVLSNLDLTKDFHDVNISGLKVKGSLIQSYQTVGEYLQQVEQSVGKILFSHKLEDNEEWKDYGYCLKRVKKITRKELEDMGYELEEE